MSKIFFTSDSHFSHTNIIRYCSRPFADTNEMDEAMIKKWNDVVKPEDICYHLGDFGLTSKEKIIEIGNRLNGHKILIKGNHDRQTNKTYYQAGFEKIHDRWMLDFRGGFDDQDIYLEHRPKFDWRPKDANFFHFCGHVHIAWTRKGNIINVGVDKWDFIPRTFDELMAAQEDYKQTNETY